MVIASTLSHFSMHKMVQHGGGGKQTCLSHFPYLKYICLSHSPYLRYICLSYCPYLGHIYMSHGTYLRYVCLSHSPYLRYICLSYCPYLRHVCLSNVDVNCTVVYFTTYVLYEDMKLQKHIYYYCFSLIWQSGLAFSADRQ